MGGVVSIFARKSIADAEAPTIYGTGKQVRSFTFVEDVVRINKFVAMTPEQKENASIVLQASKLQLKSSQKL